MKKQIMLLCLILTTLVVFLVGCWGKAESDSTVPTVTMEPTEATSLTEGTKEEVPEATREPIHGESSEHPLSDETEAVQEKDETDKDKESTMMTEPQGPDKAPPQATLPPISGGGQFETPEQEV